MTYEVCTWLLKSTWWEMLPIWQYWTELISHWNWRVGSWKIQVWVQRYHRKIDIGMRASILFLYSCFWIFEPIATSKCCSCYCSLIVGSSIVAGTSEFVFHFIGSRYSFRLLIWFLIEVNLILFWDQIIECYPEVLFDLDLAVNLWILYFGSLNRNGFCC